MSDQNRDLDMQEEMREHVARLTELNVASGMRPEEARRAALVQFGPREVIQETVRAARRFVWAGDLARDLAYGARMLRRSPGFTAVVVLTLALGIGACVAIFSVVNGILLRPLPYPESDRLVVLEEVNPPRFMGGFVRPEPYQDWVKQATSFEGMAAVRTRSYNLGGARAPVRVSAARVTANTFTTLRVEPVLGRDFLPEEDVAGKGNVVIVTHGFWMRQLGGRSEILGEKLRLDGRPFSIVGVLPRGFELAGPLDLFVPAAYVPDSQVRRSVGPQSLVVFARLKPGVTTEEARQEMALIARRRESLDSGRKGWGVKVTPMLESRVGDARPVLFALLTAVGFVLLIACTNVANLLLARASARSKEIAVRVALGASRRRLLRQLLTESLLLSFGGGLLGVIAAHVGMNTLLSLAPASLPRAHEIAVDLRVLGLTSALALVTGVIFGLAPAVHAIQTSRDGALKESVRGVAESRRHGRLRAALVVAEVAVALVLLVGAGLLMRSFVRLQEVDRGFRPDNAFTFALALSQQKYGVDTDPRIAAFAEQAAARIATLPGVEAVGASQALPFSVDLNVAYLEIAGRPPRKEPPIAYVFECIPGYFAAMGMRLVRGRLFDVHDDAKAPRVAVINESLAKKYFPDEDPIGKRMGPPGHLDRGGTIVGVVSDVRDGRVTAFAVEVANQIYVPLVQNPYDVLTFVVRERNGPHPGLGAAIRAAIAEVDPDQGIGSVRPLADWVADSVARQRFAMFLFLVFSGAALLLAALGIYGVTTYTVAQRTGEIGIRRALGAETGHVLGLVFLHGGRLVALGVALGLGGAVLLTRFLEGLLFGVSARDPTTFAAIAALLALVAALACAVPALRATKVEPMTALRTE